jgi:putative Mg2+ transporter-C (MgtC) family protein
LTFPLGWNREKEARSAGLRTFPLVALASCGFIEAAEGVVAQHPEALARIIEGVIVGMGFIGGGAILRLKDSVHGTATAASLWVTGAIGVACGVGAYDVALVLAAVAFATLRLMRPLKKAVVED